MVGMDSLIGVRIIATHKHSPRLLQGFPLNPPREDHPERPGTLHVSMEALR